MASKKPFEGNSPNASNPPFDFGEFSFRSLGVTINLPEEVAYGYPEVAGSAVYSLGWNWLDGIKTFRDLYEKRADPGWRFLIAGYSSALLHELRHYHDYLATPFGANVMIDHMLATRYTLLTLGVLAGEPTVGLPIQRWDLLSPTLHAAYKKQTRSGVFSQKPPPSLRRVTDSAHSILTRVETRLGPSPKHAKAGLTTRHLLEGSALCVQIEYIEALFGYDAARNFAQYVADLPGTALYSRLMSLFNSVADGLAAGRWFSPKVIDAIIFYALCVNDDPSKEWSHPVDRLFAVLGYLEYSREFPEDGNILDILNYVSKVFSIRTINQSLDESVAQSDQFAKSLRGLAEIDKTRGLPADEKLCDCYDTWAAAHKYMVETIRRNPMIYFDPAAYLKTLTEGEWVAAPVYLAGAGPAFQASKPVIASLKEAGWNIVFGIGDLNKSADEIQEASLLGSPNLSVGRALISREQAWYLSGMTWITSALWSTGMLSPIHRQVAATLLRSVSNWEILLL